MSSSSRHGLRSGRVVRLRIAYDGRQFLGSQRQGAGRTVQGDLEQAAERIYGRAVPIYLAGRTDSGVHAAGQVGSYAEPAGRVRVEHVAGALNAQLASDIQVLEASHEALGFHARHSAEWRHYRYRIWCGTPNPFAEGWVWCRRGSLDIQAMHRVCSVLEGTHDFASFTSGGQGVPWSSTREAEQSTVRTVYQCAASRAQHWWGGHVGDGELIEVDIIANGFLPRMVRGIVGALVQVGRGRMNKSDIRLLLGERDRRRAPMNAPAHGLTLWAVGYSGDMSQASRTCKTS